MARAHEIAIAADARGFDEGIRSGVVDPLEEAERALQDFADAADDAGRDGERGIDRITDALRDAQRQSERTEDAIDDVGSRGSGGLGKVRTAAQEVTQEMGANLGEAVSSVRGNLSDLGQVGQDTLGGLAATLAGAGPTGILGAAALAAGAVGLGMVTAELQDQQKEVDALKEHFADAWKEAIAGGRDYIDTAVVASQLQEIGFSKEYEDERKRAREVEKATGLDLQLIYRALAGDMEALGSVSAVLSEAEKERNEVIKDTLSGSRDLTSEQANAIREQHDAIVGLTGDLNNVKDAYSETEQQAAITSDALSEYWKSVIEDAGTATEEVDEFGNSLYTLPTGKQVLVTAETGKATEDVSAFKGDVDGIVDTVTTTARFVADTSDVDYQVRRLEGKTIRIGARVISSGTGWD